jgi:hypothetical protein
VAEVQAATALSARRRTVRERAKSERLRIAGVVVARHGVGLYSPPVRKFFWQRWALIFLLVSRLVIGELGHAMPVSHSMDMGQDMTHHHQMPVEMPAAASDPAACPEHEHGASEHSTAHHGGDQAADEQTSSEQDCCKSGECECPCLHLPCAALDALVLNPIATPQLRTPPRAAGLVSQRPTGLFRPPA